MNDADARTPAARSADPHAAKRIDCAQRQPLPFRSAVLWLSLCLPGAALAADIQDLRFRHDGIDRRYLLYVPDQLAASPSLVLSLHGGGGGGANAAAFENPSRHWQTLADREGIVVVYPEGVPVADVGPMWNDCRSALTGTQSMADDVSFVRALIDHLVETRGIDRSRVHVQGSSNGGMMSYRLAAELPGRFAGVAPVIANEPEDPAAECRRPSAPLGRTTLVVMNGTIDVLMPFNGGVVAQNPAQGLVISTADTIERWRQVNSCQATPVMDFLPDVDPNDGSRVRREEWSGCAAGSRLLLYRVIGGGHSMPSLATPAPTFPQNRDIEAVETIWSVFAAAPRAEIVLEAGFEPGPPQTMADGEAGKTLLAAPSPATPACSFADAHQRFAQLITDEGLPGGALLVGDRLGLRTEQYLGGYGPGTVIPIASASKLLAAVRVLQLAGRGAVDLDAPLSTYLPQFTGPKGSMTLRQMFSHTAGYGDDSFAPVLVNPSLTLTEAVNQIACCRPLNAGYTVGGQFSYGGVSMHIGGRVAEVRGGGDWQSRWQAEIGAPLGASTIDWQGFGPTSNYGIAASARSNLRDYGRVLAMLANRGRGNGVQLLEPRSVAELEVDRVGNLPIAYAPPNATPPVRYGLGSWHDNQRSPPQRPLIHSLGGAGFFPWLDFERGLYGVFMVQGNTSINAAALPVYTAMLQSIAAELDSGSCGYSERFEEVFVDGVES